MDNFTKKLILKYLIFVGFWFEDLVDWLPLLDNVSKFLLKLVNLIAFDHNFDYFYLYYGLVYFYILLHIFRVKLTCIRLGLRASVGDVSIW